jgi:hypothetical protein
MPQMQVAEILPRWLPRMKKNLRDASADELDEVFRQATVKAAKDALKAGLTVTGLDPDGRRVEAKEALVVPPDGQPDPGAPPLTKDRSRGAA